MDSVDIFYKLLGIATAVYCKGIFYTQKKIASREYFRKKLHGCGTTTIPQSVISKENKWNNQMTHGMCLCVGCMCGVMREGMCEKSK